MIRQLSIFIQNEIGSVASITAILKKHNINLRAIASFDTPQFAILRMIVDQPEKAKTLLIDSGFAVTMSEAIAVELEDKPGVLHDVLQIIADAGIGVNYIYSIVFRQKNVPLIIINTDDLEKTKQVLTDNGYSVPEQEDVIL
ncbi:MAG TPA: ACT domain-containing protein [Clostridiales bacterium]|jgi:hypothetical protein|nr:ACT domain-containing protein [Clostridiales bacterium]